MTAGIKKYRSIIKIKKHNYIVLSAKAKLNSVKGLISKVLIYSYINHDNFVSVNVSREYNEIKKEIENPETSVKKKHAKKWCRNNSGK